VSPNEGALTVVTLRSEKGVRRDRIRFGRPVAARRIARGVRQVFFAPGQVFCLVRWRRNAFGTTSWRLAVLRAGRAGDALEQVPGVAPGALVLAHFRGVDRVRRALCELAALEKSTSDLAVLTPAWWRRFQVLVLQNRPIRPPSRGQIASGAARVRCAP
jgi:hypothetical protein